LHGPFAISNMKSFWPLVLWKVGFAFCFIASSYWRACVDHPNISLAEKQTFHSPTKAIWNKRCLPYSSHQRSRYCLHLQAFHGAIAYVGLIGKPLLEHLPHVQIYHTVWIYQFKDLSLASFNNLPTQSSIFGMAILKKKITPLGCPHNVSKTSLFMAKSTTKYFSTYFPSSSHHDCYSL
jgi:hypothetical protein